MTPQDFTYWLQGFVEITGGLNRPSEQQWNVIKEHLQLTMEKKTTGTIMLTETNSLDKLDSFLSTKVNPKTNVSIDC